MMLVEQMMKGKCERKWGNFGNWNEQSELKDEMKMHACGFMQTQDYSIKELFKH